MPAPTPNGLIALRASQTEILAHTSKAGDPVAIAKTSYRRIWGGVADGVIPAERVGGRLFLRRSDLAKIAATLGVTPAVPKPSRAKCSAPSSMEAAQAA
jgi:hypothetical protein